MLPKLTASALVISIAAFGLNACSNSSNGDTMKDPASANQQMKDSGLGGTMEDGDKMKDGDGMRDGDKVKDGDGMKDGNKMKDDGPVSEDTKDSMKKWPLSDRHEGRNRAPPIPVLQASPSSESSMPKLHRAQR